MGVILILISLLIISIMIGITIGSADPFVLYLPTHI